MKMLISQNWSKSTGFFKCGMERMWFFKKPVWGERNRFFTNTAIQPKRFRAEVLEVWVWTFCHYFFLLKGYTSWTALWQTGKSNPLFSLRRTTALSNWYCPNEWELHFRKRKLHCRVGGWESDTRSRFTVLGCLSIDLCFFTPRALMCTLPGNNTEMRI